MCWGGLSLWLLWDGVWDDGKVVILIVVITIIAISMMFHICAKEYSVIAFIRISLSLCLSLSLSFIHLACQVPVADSDRDLQQLRHLLRFWQRGKIPPWGVQICNFSTTIMITLITKVNLRTKKMVFILAGLRRCCGRRWAWYRLPSNCSPPAGSQDEKNSKPPKTTNDLEIR